MTIVVIIDKEVENLECIKEGGRDLYDDFIGVLSDYEIVNEYAVNVSDETWGKIRDDSIKRLFLDESDEQSSSQNEFKYYLKNANYVFVYKDGKYKLCLPIND
ncbi:hypothetical protein [Sulfolobus islandicus rod-shaped virus 10]|uniref:Uncharacterized protein n=1 Tax=Sulfolobus islandicus rod-shaped virus 10 TaxID=1983545 RepID=A0A1X9SJU6_9VIRU|nr:hypothetical protein CCL34_gp29 [Sulfolobus islandicus rod-shaped virus 10]ARQ96496.1 hypothetical protein [Sulfolobus islandicus rod-shaped virus 10]